MTTETEALRAQFEREFGKSPYELTLSRFPEKCAWAGQYTELKTQCGWEGYQAGYAAAKAETADPVVGRWYFVANDGAATLCVDEADARESASDADIAFPRMAPHQVTQLVSASQLAAAVAAEREKCAGIVNELRMECARRNMPESATMLWHAKDAIRAGAPPDTPREAGAVAGGAA